MAIWLMYMNISPLIVYVFFNCLLKISYISPQKQPQIHTIKNNNKTSTQKKKQILKNFQKPYNPIKHIHTLMHKSKRVTNYDKNKVLNM